MVIEKPTERDILGEEMLKMFLKYKDTKDQVEIVKQGDHFTIRSMPANDGSDDYIILVDYRNTCVSPA